MPSSSHLKELATDKYHSTKFLGLFTQLLGNEGVTFQGIYSYLKWIDNNIDETNWPLDEKENFLARQEAIIKSVNSREKFSEELSIQERNFIALPWETYDVDEQVLIEQMMLNVISTTIVDVQHMDLSAKSEEEINSYAELLLNSCTRLASVLINHKDLLDYEGGLQPLAESWFAIGSLNDLVEDLDSKMLHITLNEAEINRINSLEVEDRRGAIENILNKDRFANIKKENLQKLLKNSLAFTHTNMPWWQKIGATLFNFEIIINHSLFKKNPNLGRLE